MADAIRDLLFGGVIPGRELVEAVEPRRSFDDVVLPATTMRALNHALALVRKHDLIFHQWGLSERHSTGLGLAFHFAGPPGTGKTVCAEALAYSSTKSCSWSATPSWSRAGWGRPPNTWRRCSGPLPARMRCCSSTRRMPSPVAASPR